MCTRQKTMGSRRRRKKGSSLLLLHSGFLPSSSGLACYTAHSLLSLSQLLHSSLSFSLLGKSKKGGEEGQAAPDSYQITLNSSLPPFPLFSTIIGKFLRRRNSGKTPKNAENLPFPYFSGLQINLLIPLPISPWFLSL